MNRTTVALLAALDALIVVAIGIGVALVPLTLLWAIKYHLAVSWFVFWRAASDIWLLGHGVNLTVALSPSTALALGLPTAAVPFQLTVAALGFALMAVLLGVRTGIRASETPYRQTGIVFSVATYGVLASIVTLSAGAAEVRPSIWQGIILPMFVFAVGVLIGAGIGAPRHDALPDEAATRAVRDWVQQVPSAVRAGIAAALRGGTAASGIVTAAAGIILAVLILVNFSGIVGLYEGVQSGTLGGAVLTVAQLAFLPNLVIWVAAWLIGPGFALGTGSSVSPIGTQLGPIPSVPILGALPQGHLDFGYLGLLVPVLAGFFAALFVSWRMRRSGEPHTGVVSALLIAIGIGVVAGVELGLLAWWSSGAIGPGRLHNAGPDPWLVGLFAAGEVAVAAVVGMLAGRRTS